MIQTTYNLLIDSDTDPNFISQMESVTGARQAYGLNTPINVSTVLDALGLEAALTCFYRSTTDNAELSKVIGLAWVNAHVYAYNAVFPSDSRVSDLMYYCSLFLQSGPTPPRFDYCGRDLTGPGLIPLSTITDLAAAIQATVNGLPTTQGATVYQVIIFNSGPLTDQQYANALGNNIIALDRNHPINDPAIQTPTGTVGYTEQPIANITTNPDVFVNAQFTYDPASRVYYVASWQNQSTGGTGTHTIPAFGNQAALGLGTAAVFASQQVSSNSGFLLAQICNQIRVGINSYNSQQLTLLAPKRTLYQQMANGMPVANTGNPTFDADAQTVLNAGLNRRAALLRDQTYLTQFDTDFSHSLSSAELVNAEKAIQVEMITARKLVAQALYDAVNAQFLALDTVTDTLAAVMRPFLL